MDKVIFDTNAYRYLVNNKSFEEIDKTLAKVNYRERENDIETLISPVVAKGLLAHVAYQSDPSHDKCLKAIKALYLHSGNRKEYNMIASPELLISKAFFGKEIPEKIETNKAIGQMVYHLATNPSEHVFRKLQRNLNSNHKHVNDAENEFASAMKDFLYTLDPNAKGWRVFLNDEKGRKKALEYLRSHKVSLEIASGFLTIVDGIISGSNDPGSSLNKDTLEKAHFFVETFPEPIALWKLVAENLINSEFNLYENSRANFIWDIQLMFNVGKHTIGNDLLTFVTADKAMIRTALGQSNQYSILTYDEYMEYLGLK